MDNICYLQTWTGLYLLNMHYRGELDIDNGKHVLACFETRNYLKWILKQLINSELSRRMLSTSADNTLLDLHNSSYPTQPHSLIANYPICCIFCPVLPMFLKGWCGQPKIFFFFKTPMRRLDCFCPSGYMWYTPAMAWLGGCEGSLSGLLKKCVGNIFVSKASLFLSLFFAAWSLDLIISGGQCVGGHVVSHTPPKWIEWEVLGKRRPGTRQNRSNES